MPKVVRNSEFLQGIIDVTLEAGGRNACAICGALLEEDDLGPDCRDCSLGGFDFVEDPFDGDLWEKIDEDMLNGND